MIATFQVSENILEAHGASGTPIDFPFSSFAQLIYERVNDPLLSKQTFLAFYDNDRKEHRTYTYAEFGELVSRAITYLRDHLGVQRGDRIADFEPKPELRPGGGSLTFLGLVNDGGQACTEPIGTNASRQIITEAANDPEAFEQDAEEAGRILAERISQMSPEELAQLRRD